MGLKRNIYEVGGDERKVQEPPINTQRTDYVEYHQVLPDPDKISQPVEMIPPFPEDNPAQIGRQYGKPLAPPANCPTVLTKAQRLNDSRLVFDVQSYLNRVIPEDRAAFIQKLVAADKKAGTTVFITQLEDLGYIL